MSNTISNNYILWVESLSALIQTDNIFHKYNNLSIETRRTNQTKTVESLEDDADNIELVVKDKTLSNRSLIIDSTTIKPYYDKLGGPQYTYADSLNYAKGACLNFIKQWVG